MYILDQQVSNDRQSLNHKL